MPHKLVQFHFPDQNCPHSNCNLDHPNFGQPHIHHSLLVGPYFLQLMIPVQFWLRPKSLTRYSPDWNLKKAHEQSIHLPMEKVIFFRDPHHPHPTSSNSSSKSIHTLKINGSSIFPRKSSDAPAKFLSIFSIRGITGVDSESSQQLEVRVVAICLPRYRNRSFVFRFFEDRSAVTVVVKKGHL